MDDPVVIVVILVVSLVLAWRELRIQRDEEQERLRARRRTKP